MPASRAAALAAAACGCSASAAAGGPTREIAPGVEMPVVAMGTPHSPVAVCCGGGGRAVNHTCCDAAMRDAAGLWWASGGVAVETSIAYGTGVGLGAAFAASGRGRDAVFLQGKVQCRGTEDEVSALIDQHLGELGVSYVDLLTIHYPNGVPAHGVPSCDGGSMGATWRAFEAARKAGKTRAIGTSSFSSAQLQRILDLGGAVPAYNQFPMEVGVAATARSNLTDVLAFCKGHGITVGGFSSLSHGCMGLAEVQGIATAHNRSAAQVCLRWVTQLGCNVVVSSAAAEYDKQDLASVEFDLSAQEMETLSAL